MTPLAEIPVFDLEQAILELDRLGLNAEELEGAAVDLDLATAVAELYQLGLIAEEIDEHGTPRFKLTGLKPEEVL